MKLCWKSTCWLKNASQLLSKRCVACVVVITYRLPGRTTWGFNSVTTKVHHWMWCWATLHHLPMSEPVSQSFIIVISFLPLESWNVCCTRSFPPKFCMYFLWLLADHLCCCCSFLYMNMYSETLLTLLSLHCMKCIYSMHFRVVIFLY